jgi:FtsH-binding integral membrane protein
MAAIFRSNYMIFLYDIIGALIYTIYIAFDAIIIRDALSIDDYIFAAFILTIDLIRLFIIILKILGSISGNK